MHRLRDVRIQVPAMPALIGYMLAIVVTLGGYFVGLHWLISPPDPWQANARMQTTGSAHPAAKKRPAARPVEVAEVAARVEPAAAKAADVTPSTAEPTLETRPPVAMNASAPASPVQAAV